MKTLSQALAEVQRQIEAAESKLAQLRAVREYLSNEVNDDSPSNVNGVGARGSQVTQREAAEIVLRELGRAARVDEILDTALARKLLVMKSTRRNVANSLYGAMVRNADVFRKSGPGIFDLVHRS